MTHPYNECTSNSIDIQTSFDSKAKDQLGILIIGLIGCLGLGYMLFNPIFLSSNNFSNNTTSFQKSFSAGSLNSEKTADNVLFLGNTNAQTATYKGISTASLAADATH